MINRWPAQSHNATTFYEQYRKILFVARERKRAKTVTPIHTRKAREPSIYLEKFVKCKPNPFILGVA